MNGISSKYILVPEGLSRSLLSKSADTPLLTPRSCTSEDPESAIAKQARFCQLALTYINSSKSKTPLTWKIHTNRGEYIIIFWNQGVGGLSQQLHRRDPRSDPDFLNKILSFVVLPSTVILCRGPTVPCTRTVTEYDAWKTGQRKLLCSLFFCTHAYFCSHSSLFISLSFLVLIHHLSSQSVPASDRDSICCLA
jgi:hypothetical protein